MHRPAPLEISPTPSRIARLWVVTLALGTIALAFTLPFASWANAVAAALIGLWTARCLRELGRGRHAIRRLRVDAERAISITTVDGRTIHGRLLPSTCVGARLTTLVWRPEGRRFARAEYVVADMLSPDEFRRLRVLLRYGRSEPTQGAPPSQA